jgi:hypothetical protein
MMAAGTRTVPGWLSHLRTDRRGLPVPYINQWGLEEDLARVSIRHDRHIGGPGLHYDDIGLTVPDFTKQNWQRQRECMLGGRCQVCHRPVPWSRRFLVLAAMSVDQVRMGNRTYGVVTEPWLDDRCARYAMEVCPALIRRTREEQLTLVPITSKWQGQLLTSVGWVEGPLEVESKRVQPAMWVKFYLPDLVVTVGQGGRR